MRSIAARVVARFLTAASNGDLKKFQQITDKAKKEIALIPRLCKSYVQQTRGYKTQDPAKAKVTEKKIRSKVEAISDGYLAASRLVGTFSKNYSPTNAFKQRLFTEDFKNWLAKYQDALHRLSEEVENLSPLTISRLSSGLDGGYVRPGQNPMHDLQNAAGGIDMYWTTLTKADPDPVHIPKGGSNKDRFLAFLTPSIRRLAKQFATKIKKDKSVARSMVWLVLTDVNAHSAASTAEGLLSFDDSGAEATQVQVNTVAGALDYGIVQAGVFGVALLEAVGDAVSAQRLTMALAEEFSEHTNSDDAD